MKKNIIFIPLMFLLSGITPIFSATGVNILKIEFGNRAISMGSAYAAANGDSSSIYWNPAGLEAVQGKEIIILHRSWIMDTFSEGAAFAWKLENIGVVAAHISVFLGSRDDEIDENGFNTGIKLTSSSFIFSTAFARGLFFKINGGAALKYVHENIAGMSHGFFLTDIGLQRTLYETPSDGIRLGIVLQNWDFSFNSKGDIVPVNLKIGLAYTAYENFKLLLDVNKQFESIYFRYNLGAEYTFYKWFSIRAGYKLNYDLENFTLGCGINPGFFLKHFDCRLDYALTGLGFAGTSQNIALRILW